MSYNFDYDPSLTAFNIGINQARRKIEADMGEQTSKNSNRSRYGKMPESLNIPYLDF